MIINKRNTLWRIVDATTTNINEINEVTSSVTVLCFMLTLIVIILIISFFYEESWSSQYIDFLNPSNIESRWLLWPSVSIIFFNGPAILLIFEISRDNLDYIVHMKRNIWYWKIQSQIFNEESRWEVITKDSYINNIRVNRYLRTERFSVLSTSSCRVSTSSNDVLHSVSIPQLNYHIDATPRRISIARINPIDVRIYFGSCQELCRFRHSNITFNVYIV